MPSGRVTRAGDKRVGRTPAPGPYSAGCPGSREKPTPRLWRKTPVSPATRWAPKSRALDWVSEIPRPSASTAHRWVVSPSESTAVLLRGPSSCGFGRRCPRRDRWTSRAALEPLEREQLGAVGTVEEHRRAIEAGGAPRLGDQVRPQRVVGVGRDADLLGDPGAGECQVALGGRRNRPQVVAEGPQHQRLDPLRQRSGQIVGRVLPVAQLEERSAELAAVEPVSSPRGQTPKRPGDAGKTDELSRLERPLGAELRRAGNVGDEMTGEGQDQRGGEAVLGQRDGRLQHRLPRKSSVALVQCQPSVDGTGNGNAPDVPAQRHVGDVPRRAGDPGSAPDPALPTARRASGGCPGALTIASASPPRPHRWGPTTAITEAAATMASAAEPPRRAWRGRRSSPAGRPQRPCRAPPPEGGTGSCWPRRPGYVHGRRVRLPGIEREPGTAPPTPARGLGWTRLRDPRVGHRHPFPPGTIRVRRPTGARGPDPNVGRRRCRLGRVEQYRVTGRGVGREPSRPSHECRTGTWTGGDASAL